MLLGLAFKAVGLVAVTKMRIGRAANAVIRSMSKPYEGIATRLDVVDREKNRIVRVVSRRNPLMLVLSMVFRRDADRRASLVREISRLASVYADGTFVLHYWLAKGKRISLLTGNARRALSPPPAPKHPPPVMAAITGEGVDVTAHVKAVEGSFYPGEEMRPRDLRRYLRAATKDRDRSEIRVFDCSMGVRSFPR